MESETAKIRSCIDPQYKRKILLRGTFLAACGALLLLAPLFLQPTQLKQWGLSIFLLASALIAFGLVPYRRLTQLETTPNELVLDNKALYFFQKKRPVLSIPNEQIQKMSYEERQGKCGLAVKLKDPYPEKFTLSAFLLNRKDLEFSNKDYDLFFPYFSKSSCHSFIQEFEEIKA